MKIHCSLLALIFLQINSVLKDHNVSLNSQPAKSGINKLSYPISQLANPGEPRKEKMDQLQAVKNKTGNSQLWVGFQTCENGGKGVILRREKDTSF